jgi:hypothetical protein
MLTVLRHTIAQNRWWDAIFVLYVTAFCIDLIFLQHGRIGSELGISVRQIIFLLLMLTALFNCFQLRRVPLTTIGGLLVLGLVIPIAWGALGVANGNELRHVVNDANGHLFYLLAFALLLGFRPDFPSKMVMGFAMLLVAFLCTISLIAYVYALIGVEQANHIEKLLREGDYGFFNVFEDGRPYRVFLSSYLFLPILICYSIQRLMVNWRTRHAVDVTGSVYLVLGLATMIVSQTRSLWVGAIAGLAIMLVYLIHRTSRRLIAVAGLAGLCGGGLVLLVAPQFLRLADIDGSAGMRLGQVVLLFDLFTQRPWLGWGFGTVIDIVMYRSASFSHEMDLIDLLRKIGSVGLVVYLGAFFALLRSAWRQYRIDEFSEEVGMLLATLAVVFTVGFFNPYATASIGIGAIVLALVTVEFRNLTLLSPDAPDCSQR